jgi:hypothetical protein
VRIDVWYRESEKSQTEWGETERIRRGKTERAKRDRVSEERQRE